MRLPWIGPREQACMLAEKERSSLESDLPSLLRGNGPGSGESLSVEEPMSVERALLSISNGKKFILEVYLYIQGKDDC